MHKTKSQKLVFSLLMVFSMVFVMATFNSAQQDGFSYMTFARVLQTMWLELPVAFILQLFVAVPIAARLLPKIVNPQSERRIMVSVAMTGCNVLVMAPMMTLFVCLVRNGFSLDIPLKWLPRLVINFPFALFVNIFYVGPFVRFAHRTIYNRNSKNN
jgi:hypothetical protein